MLIFSIIVTIFIQFSFIVLQAEIEAQLDQLLSVLIVRGDIEMVEEEMALTFGFPSKGEMIKKLQDKNLWINSTHTTHKLTNRGSIHLVKWMFFLNFAQDNLANSIRQILQTKQVEILMFSVFIAKIFEKTSSIIHTYKADRVTNVHAITDGLKAYGINDAASLKSVQILQQIKKLPLSR